MRSLLYFFLVQDSFIDEFSGLTDAAKENATRITNVKPRVRNALSVRP